MDSRPSSIYCQVASVESTRAVVEDMGDDNGKTNGQLAQVGNQFIPLGLHHWYYSTDI